MTDNEIIKALERCIFGECENCPHDEETACKENLNQEVLDLINRQKAEIESQSENFKVLVSDHRTLQQSFANLKGLYEAEKAKVEKAKEKCVYFAKEVQKARAETDRVTAIGAEWKEAAYTYADNIDRIKAEAIKEFAERLKEKFSGVSLCNNGFVNSTLINIVKEMVGDAE